MKKTKNKSINEVFITVGRVVIIVWLILAIIISYIPELQRMVNHHINRLSVTEMMAVLDRVPKSARLILVSHRDEMMMIMATDEARRESISLNDIFDRIDKLKDGEDICARERRMCDSGVYFIETEACDNNKVTKMICDSTAIKGKLFLSGESWSIYDMSEQK